MKENAKWLIGAATVIICFCIYAASTRYAWHPKAPVRLDRWTGAMVDFR